MKKRLSSDRTKQVDREFLQKALHLSKKGLGWVNPNPLVGAILVKGKTVLGKGYHKKSGLPHAEINAIQQAKQRGHSLKGSTLYVTLEPCCHHGKTPPCTDAIISSGIKRVVICEKDPNKTVCGKGISKLRKKGIKVEVGLLKEEALKQNQIYRHWITQNLPLVTLKMSISLDGKISPGNKEKGKVFYLIGKEALNRVHSLRQTYDAILVGIETLLQDDPQLNTRLPKLKSLRHPRPVVLDQYGRTPLDSKILKSITTRPIIFVGKKATKENIDALTKKGAKVVKISTDADGLKISEVLEILKDLQITSVLVEGGARIAHSFLKGHWVNRLEIALAPIIIGPEGIPMVLGAKNGHFPQILSQMEHLQVESLGKDLWLSGNLMKN